MTDQRLFIYISLSLCILVRNQLVVLPRAQSCRHRNFRPMPIVFIVQRITMLWQHVREMSPKSSRTRSIRTPLVHSTHPPWAPQAIRLQSLRKHVSFWIAWEILRAILRLPHRPLHLSQACIDRRMFFNLIFLFLILHIWFHLLLLLNRCRILPLPIRHPRCYCPNRLCMARCINYQPLRTHYIMNIPPASLHPATILNKNSGHWRRQIFLLA